MNVLDCYKLYINKTIENVEEKESWLKFTFTDGSILSLRLITDKELNTINLLKGIAKNG